MPWPSVLYSGVTKKLSERRMNIVTCNGYDADAVWWWLALNGPSCAASALSFLAKGLEVSPVRQQLIGVPTQAEQRRLQEFLLNAPSDSDVTEIRAKIDSGEWAHLVPLAPEQPHRGPTAWLGHPRESGEPVADG